MTKYKFAEVFIEASYEHEQSSGDQGVRARI